MDPIFDQIDAINPKHVTVITSKIGKDRTRVTVDILGADGIDIRLGFYVCNSQTANDTP